MVLLQGINWAYWLTLQYEMVFEAISRSMRGMLAGLAGRLPYILAGLIVLLVFWLLGKLIRWIFLSTSRKARMDTQLRILISRLIGVFVFVIGLFASLSVVVESFNFGQVIAGLGFTSFVVGFATKDILSNFLSGILILWQRPFHIGDYLFVGSNQGKVEHIGVRATMLRKDDGEGVLIPNGEMYSSALTIRAAGKLRRMTLKFTLGFDADLERAKQLIQDTVTTLAGVEAEPQPGVLVTEFTGDGAMLTVQFWINTNQNKPLQVFDNVSIEVLKALSAARYEVNRGTSELIKELEAVSTPTRASGDGLV
ncbi:MAG: mechanosensitive ion channel family protein [bacterium]|nr:mechanosensitive ion channel family protein [bacterium]